MTVGLKVNGYTSGVWLVSGYLDELNNTTSIVLIVICHLMEDHSKYEKCHDNWPIVKLPNDSWTKNSTVIPMTWLVSGSLDELIKTPSIVVIVICHLMDSHSIYDAMTITQL